MVTIDDPEDKRPLVPQSLNIQLRWESGGYESDALHRGASKDKRRGRVNDTYTRPTSEMVLQNLHKELEDSLP